MSGECRATVVWAGEAGFTQSGMPVMLARSQAEVGSDPAGLASFAVSTGSFTGNVIVIGSATIGSSDVDFVAQQFGP